MKNYYRVMLGKGSQYAAECLTSGFIGADFGIEENLNGQLPEDWREFNHAFVPKWEALHPGKSRILRPGSSCRHRHLTAHSGRERWGWGAQMIGHSSGFPKSVPPPAKPNNFLLDRY